MKLVATIARWWPFANGSGRIIDRFGRSTNLGSGEQETVTSDGVRMSVLADDLIGRHILLTGKFDRSVVQVLLDHSRPDDVLLDVGANIGYVSSCFLACVARSSVICVEPQPTIVDLLAKNLMQFGARVSIHQVALSEKAGQLRFHVDRDNRGASKVCDDGEIVVPAINAAELLSSISRVDIIKIDVEGHEEHIFRAIERELARLKPRAILFEDHGTSASTSGVIGSILRRVGYSIYAIDKRLFKTSLTEVDCKADCRVNDYLAVRTSS